MLLPPQDVYTQLLRGLTGYPSTPFFALGGAPGTAHGAAIGRGCVCFVMPEEGLSFRVQCMYPILLFTPFQRPHIRK